MPGDERGDAGAVPEPVTAALVGAARLRQVEAGQDVANEVGVVGIDASVDHRDGDALTTGDLVHVADLERFQVPLAVASLVRADRRNLGGRGDVSGHGDVSGRRSPSWRGLS